MFSQRCIVLLHEREKDFHDVAGLSKAVCEARAVHCTDVLGNPSSALCWVREVVSGGAEVETLQAVSNTGRN